MSIHRPIIATLLLLALNATAIAADLVVENAWVREGPPAARALSAYAEIYNPGPGTLTLTGAACPDFDRVELHKTVVEGGVARMIAQPRIEIAPGSRLEFKPGADHIMLIGPKRRLVEGDTVRLVLHLDDGSTHEVEMPVRRQAAAQGHHGHGH